MASVSAIAAAYAASPVAIPSTNVAKWVARIAQSRTRADENGPKTIRATFTHRGRKYAAVRFRGGRAELYSVGKDGWTETFLRYAAPRAGALDVAAIEAADDRLDDAAIQARSLLRGSYGTAARNVRFGEPCGAWGSVLAEYTHPETGKSRTIYASIRLYHEVRF